MRQRVHRQQIFVVHRHNCVLLQHQHGLPLYAVSRSPGRPRVKRRHLEQRHAPIPPPPRPREVSCAMVVMARPTKPLPTPADSFRRDPPRSFLAQISGSAPIGTGTVSKSREVQAPSRDDSAAFFPNFISARTLRLQLRLGSDKLCNFPQDGGHDCWDSRIFLRDSIKTAWRLNGQSSLQQSPAQQRRLPLNSTAQR